MAVVVTMPERVAPHFLPLSWPAPPSLLKACAICFPDPRGPFFAQEDWLLGLDADCRGTACCWALSCGPFCLEPQCQPFSEWCQGAP